MSGSPVKLIRPDSWLKSMRRKDDQVTYSVEFLMFEQSGGIIGFGFLIRGLVDSLFATFSDKSWWIIENERGEALILRDLLDRGLRVHDSDCQAFTTEWRRLFEVYSTSRRAAPPRTTGWSDLQSCDWGRAVLATIERAIGKFGRATVPAGSLL